MLRVYFLFALFGVALAAPNRDDHHDHDGDHHEHDSDHSYTYDPWFQAVLAKYNISVDSYHPGFVNVTLQTATDTYVSCGAGHFIMLDNLVALIPNPESCDQTYCVDEESCSNFATTLATYGGLQLIVTAPQEDDDDDDSDDDDDDDSDDDDGDDDDDDSDDDDDDDDDYVAVDVLANLDADDEVILYIHDQFYVDFYNGSVQGGSAYPEQEKK